MRHNIFARNFSENGFRRSGYCSKGIESGKTIQPAPLNPCHKRMILPQASWAGTGRPIAGCGLPPPMAMRYTHRNRFYEPPISNCMLCESYNRENAHTGRMPHKFPSAISPLPLHLPPIRRRIARYFFRLRPLHTSIINQQMKIYLFTASLFPVLDFFQNSVFFYLTQTRP